MSPLPASLCCQYTAYCLLSALDGFGNTLLEWSVICDIGIVM